ncbi:MAG: polysaccharide deacetylase family protein [Cyclobacteriaceae bacterium]|nr:polysaccharide deacetylase family protein [Cyclobacteriaceae bacterium]
MPSYKKLNLIFFILLAGLVSYDLYSGIFILWYVVLVVIYVSLCVAGAFILSAGFFLPVKCRGNRSENKIALTFDDGPIAGQTERVLEILKAHQVQGTFFCIGSRINKNPNLLLQIKNEGHLIGNHTYNHKSTFGFLPAKSVSRELHNTDKQIEEIIGKKPRYFRPPYGVTNPMIAKAIAEGNYTTIGWSIRSFDTIIKDPVKLFSRVTAPLSSGDIILFHDYSNSMIEVLPKFIQYAKHKGMQFALLDELLNEKPYR